MDRHHAQPSYGRTELSQPPSHAPQRTANTTPVSSPGLFSPTNTRSNMSLRSQRTSEGASPATDGSPYLHPLQVQSHRIKETNKANVDTDFTGRKLINRYLVLEELGRGMHGKVKLAKNLDNEEHVAIKIVQRFSKKRKLSKITTMPTQEKSKREIAILKKIRHPNVVALLEVIDDPELKKIYMVLEFVELGEIVWRKKGIPAICNYERRRIEREMLGHEPTPEDERCRRLLEKRHASKTAKRAKMARAQDGGGGDYWSLEYGAADDDDADSQAQSLPRVGSGSQMPTAQCLDTEPPTTPNEDDLETPVPKSGSSSLEATSDAFEDAVPRARSPSNADSVMSHMSSFDHNRDYSQYQNDLFADDYSYVPCFEMEVARQTFRETVLGLEYLHYEGVIHRDIKPANLLWTRDHHVKISDFGVSHFGRPIRPGEADDTVSESEAKELDDDFELSKTVGTPAFFAPEICGFEEKEARPKVTEQIDVWSLGVTLYCLIFARIPFLAEDEYKMWRKIAKDDVFIPRKRLRPVDPNTKPDEKSLYTRINRAPYRDDDELSYEEIGDHLHDVLSKMLTKNPDERIRLREVKMHPWVTHGITNVQGWLKDTDPSNSGRRIQVDEKEIQASVVPLSSFLCRAKSAVKKAVDKVMPHRSEGRRRAASSAASLMDASVASAAGSSSTQQLDARRKSPRPDDYFAHGRRQQASDHPLSQSVTASPDRTPGERMPRWVSDEWKAPVGHSTMHMADKSGDFDANQDADEARAGKDSRHSHSRSSPNPLLALTNQPMPPMAMHDLGVLRKGRDMRPLDDACRARSADRALFTNGNKRAEARISISTAVAPGNVSMPPRVGSPILSSPSSPRTLTGYQHGQYRSVPNMQEGRAVDMKQRPRFAAETRDVKAADASDVACPSSPLSQPSREASRQGRAGTAVSSSSTSVPTPLTSPSETAASSVGSADDKPSQNVPGFPLEVELQVRGRVAELDHHSLSQPSPAPTSSESDDDDGLIMANLKKRPSRASSTVGMHASRRRNTNASIASTDTAKKIFVDNDPT